MKSSGVTKKNYKTEQELGLWGIGISSLEDADKITNWICSKFDLERVLVKFSISSKLFGMYDSETNKIFLYPLGNNLATLVHEMAHHYCFQVFKKGGHKKEFSQSHSLILLKIGEYLNELKTSS